MLNRQNMWNKFKVLILVANFVILSSCSIKTTNDNICPNQPSGTLDPANVKSITLLEKESIESGQINSNQNLGYIFRAKAGQKLNLDTKKNLCVWVFTPSNKLLKGNDLPEDGNYTLQVSTLGGAGSFKLAMRLEDKFQVSNTNISSKPESVDTSSSDSSELNQDNAKSVVQNWLDAKNRIFAPPFDRYLVSQLTTGELYYDITKPDGSMSWLENNGSYYSYDLSRVDEVLEFNNSSSPFIKVRLTEDRTLHGKDGNIDYNESGRATKNYTYFFLRENGVWKISDYK